MRASFIAGAALAAVLSSTPAWADLHELSGDRLVLTTGSGDVTVDTDRSAHGRVTIETSDETCGASAASGGTVTIETAGCDGTVHITVPAHFPLTLTSAGDGKIHLGQDIGPLVATLTADGSLYAGHVESLVLAIHGDGNASVDAADGDARLEITGNGDARVKQVNGALTVDVHGSGDIVVGGVHAPSAIINGDGTGSVLLGQGDIRTLSVHLNGPGDLAVAATVHDADLRSAGGGDIRLSKTTGTINRDATGGSSITLGDNTVEAFVLGKIAGAVTDADDEHPNNPLVINLHTHDHGRHDDSGSGSHGGGHFLAGIIVLGIAWMVFNTMRRNGALARMQQRFTGSAAPAPAAHPGVIAVRDAMARLEQRLGRVELYVTSREFDLQQKFRDLDKTP